MRETSVNNSINVSIAATLAVLALSATTARGEAPQTLPEITVTASPTTDTGYVATHSTTATKTDTPIFDLPVSIQVVPREVLDDRQVIRLQDALQTVSGVVPFAGAQTLHSPPSYPHHKSPHKSQSQCYPIADAQRAPPSVGPLIGQNAPQCSSPDRLLHWSGPYSLPLKMPLFNFFATHSMICSNLKSPSFNNYFE